MMFASCFNSKFIHPTYVDPTIPVALPPNLDITPTKLFGAFIKSNPILQQVVMPSQPGC